MSNAQRRRGAQKRVRKKDVTGPIERESARLLRIVAELGEERASRPLVAGWSVRDVIAHCVYWQGMLARMMGAPLPHPNWLPLAADEAELGRDELNRRTVEHYATFSVDSVVADFVFTAGLVRRIVNEMQEENLMVEAGAPWAERTPVWEAIGGETHAHWKEHADEIEAALATQGATRRSS